MNAPTLGYLCLLLQCNVLSIEFKCNILFIASFRFGDGHHRSHCQPNSCINPWMISLSFKCKSKLVYTSSIHILLHYTGSMMVFIVLLVSLNRCVNPWIFFRLHNSALTNSLHASAIRIFSATLY